jgi:hypothetical protein
MTPKEEIGRGLGALGVMLLIVSFLLSSGKMGAGFMILVFGWIFFGAGGGTSPLRHLNLGGLASVLFGLLLMALSVVWIFIYKDPWVFRFAEIVFLEALVFVAAGQLVLRQRRAI